MMKSMRFIFMLLFAFTVLGAVSAQQEKEAQVRTIHGVVVDKQDNVVSGGIVYLQNKKTQIIRTYISDDTGQYRFSGLDLNVDYEIHAELNGLTSISRTVSTFDTRKEIVMTLKLDRKKGDK